MNIYEIEDVLAKSRAVLVACSIAVFATLLFMISSKF